ncbi:MAG: SpoIID/LytB domain-containing protein [Firmicutes bacterium]|nr:SpoIID/LytB domain-containing protein [Bacillota bacterium]
MKKTYFSLLLIMLCWSADALGKPLILPADKVMRISASCVEFEHHGILPLKEGVEAFHHWEGEFYPMPLEGVKVGFQEVVPTLEQGEVSRFDVYDPLYIRTMRVALSKAEFEGIEHQELIFSPTSKLFVEETGTGRGFIIEEGREGVVSAREGKLFFEDGQGNLWEFERRLYLWADPGGKIQINSFRRGSSTRFYPQYRGRIELTVVGPNQFLAINEVDLEEYLYQVVPSEMPITWPKEALKAQAVASRTYAVAQAIYSREGHLGFHVSDSTNSQVYNNQAEAAAATEAIKATAGEILVSETGTIASTYFYSTSPGGPLTSRAEWEQMESLALEGNSPWFRWKCTFSKKELEASLKNHLPGSLGKIRDLKIGSRDQEGRVASLEIEGSTGRTSIQGELQIRSALRPSGLKRTGDVLSSFPLLPSAFFTLECQRDEDGSLESVIIFGGGSGHGLGMSQWGAKGLAEAGSDYLSILKRYYPKSHLIEHSERLRY